MSLNHYVPSFILKNFENENGVLWVMDKKDGHCFSDKGERNKAFAENNYNPDKVEDSLYQIESSASGIVKEILESARRDETPELNVSEKECLCNFLTVQILRVPRVKNWVMNKDWERPGDKEYLWRMCSELLDNIVIVDLKKAKVDVNLSEHPHLEKIICARMMDMNLNVLRIRQDLDMAFLISDEPCLMKGMLATSGDCVTMPLAKDVFIELSRPEDSPGGMHDASTAWIEELNLQSYVKADRLVAGSSREYLKSVREKAKQVF